MGTAVRKQAGREASSWFAFIFRAELFRGAQTTRGVLQRRGGHGLCTPQGRMTQQHRLRAPAQRCPHGSLCSRNLPAAQGAPRVHRDSAPRSPPATPPKAAPRRPTGAPASPAGPPTPRSPSGRTPPSRGGAERRQLADTGREAHPEGRPSKHFRVAGPVAASEVRVRIGSVRVGPYLPAPR